MPPISEHLKTFLDEHAVAFETIHHRPDYTAPKTAADTHTPGREFAKTLILWVDGQYTMAVLPAHHMVDLEKLSQGLEGKEIRLSSEDQIRVLIDNLCPDCELGAMSPFGNLYDLPVYMNAAMTEDEQITFNAGTHQDGIRMRYSDYEKLVGPRVIEFSRQFQSPPQGYEEG